MIDREKVITNVEEAIKILGAVDEPTFWLDFVRVAVENALKLLKQDGCENCAMAIEDRQMIVRCKDCKWWENGRCENDYVHQQIYDDGCYPDFHTYSDWFCAEGERR